MLRTLTATALLMLTAAGCHNGATLARKNGTGGRVALQGAYMPAMADARLLMVDHCRGRYQAMELGDSVEFRCRKQYAAANAAEVAIANAAPAQTARGL